MNRRAFAAIAVVAGLLVYGAGVAQSQQPPSEPGMEPEVTEALQELWEYVDAQGAVIESLVTRIDALEAQVQELETPGEEE